MLDNLMNLVRQHAGDAIVNNPAIPNERNDEAIQETGNSIIGTLQNALAGGGLKNVMRLFSGSQEEIESNPVVQDSSNGLQQTLQEKFNLNGPQASGIAGSLIPTILKQFAQKTNDPQDNSFQIQDIFNQLSGGRTSNVNMNDMLSKFKGRLDTDGDNDVDLQDLQGMFSGGGSVMDKLKGLFG